MYEHETFPNAPITEAVADVAMRFHAPPKFDDLQHFGAVASGSFPVRRERRAFSTNVEAGSDGPVIKQTENRFLSFVSSDEKHVVQIRPDGFAFSRAKPYTNWQHFKENTIDGLDKYLSVFRPTSIERISLKYVNRISLPFPINDFDDYFITGLKIAPELPQQLSRVFYSFGLPDTETKSLGNVTFAIDYSGTTKEVLSVIFDVEALMVVQAALDLKSISKILDDLRDFKNKLFFLSITEKTKGLFR